MNIRPLATPVQALSLAVLFGAAAVIAAVAPASAAQRHVMHLIRLPNGDCTLPKSELIDPAWKGTVSLRAQGLRTIVIVSVPAKSLRSYALELHPGSDCSALGVGNNIPLNPAIPGVPSRTLVSLPLTNLTSQDYVVAVRDATTARQYRETCAHL